MICLNCRKAMIVVEYHQIELDYCHKCRGVWFDASELELFLESAGLESLSLGIKDILNLPELKLAHRRRKCPLCGCGMRETVIGKPPINIDVCRRGDGLWFDGGELSELLRQLGKALPAGKSSERQILTFLGEVFKIPEQGHISC